jgi:tRNA-modifying protein YgfZ
MPDNPLDHWFALTDHRILSLNGRDAIAFAQSQFMNDVAALGDGQWHWNGWLTPKGRVIALFGLLRIDPSTVWLVVADADLEALAASLRRFVFRSKVQITVRQDLHVIGRFGASERASGHHWAGNVGTGAEMIELDMSGDGGSRALRILAAPTAPAEDAASLTDWKRFDLAHGWPRLEATQREQWTPQQLSLDRLGAYSVKKGCYPGQEIVARTHFLGQAKRGLALLRTASPLTSGAALEHQGVHLGTVVAAVDDHAIAIVALDTISADAKPDNDESPALGGASWSFVPLSDGLRR